MSLSGDFGRFVSLCKKLELSLNRPVLLWRVCMKKKHSVVLKCTKWNIAIYIKNIIDKIAWKWAVYYSKSEMLLSNNPVETLADLNAKLHSLIVIQLKYRFSHYDISRYCSALNQINRHFPDTCILKMNFISIRTHIICYRFHLMYYCSSLYYHCANTQLHSIWRHQKAIGMLWNFIILLTGTSNPILIYHRHDREGCTRYAICNVTTSRTNFNNGKRIFEIFQRNSSSCDPICKCTIAEKARSRALSPLTTFISYLEMMEDLGSTYYI